MPLPGNIETQSHDPGEVRMMGSPSVTFTPRLISSVFSGISA